MNITSNDILKLLRQKHPVEKFVSVEECKVGSSWFLRNCYRLDMWVMARSWAHPQFIGYEIKVNRSNFLTDIKWKSYLDYCTEFYFVCPQDIIDPRELPDEAGLIVTSKNVRRLYTKKKAPMRSIEIPQTILLYILMSRTMIVKDIFNTSPKIERWKKHLKDLKENKKVGGDLSYFISKRVKDQVAQIQEENQRLHEENNRYRCLAEWLSQNNIDLNEVTTRYGSVGEDRLKEILNGLPFKFEDFLEKTQYSLGQVIETVRKYREK